LVGHYALLPSSPHHSTRGRFVMSAKEPVGKGHAGLVRSKHRASDPPMLGRKSVLMGMLTSGFVIANAAQPSATAAGTVKPGAIAATTPTYLTKWAPSQAYVRGQQVVSPNNDVVSANVAHTSGSTFNAANWSVSSTYARRSIVNVLDFGTINGSTDHATIAAAIAAADARPGSGGIVFFPYVSSGYGSESKLYIPRCIRLVGEHDYVSTLKYTGSTVLDRFLEFGGTGSDNPSTGLADITIDANNHANAAVMLWGPQEGSGIARCLIINALIVCIDVISNTCTGGANKFCVSDSWMWTNGDAGLAGIRFGEFSNYAVVENTTCVGSGRTVAAPSNSAGVAVTLSRVTLNNVHVELFENHCYSDTAHVVLRNPTAYSHTNGFKSNPGASYATGVSITDATYYCGSTGYALGNDILDPINGVTIPKATSYLMGDLPWDGTLSDFRRHSFRAQWDEYLQTSIYKSQTERTTLGYSSSATGDTTQFKTTFKTATAWVVSHFIDTDGTAGAGSAAWNGAHQRVGAYHLWVDSSGRLRIKATAPTSDTDGTVVGTQA
jgi:hypothetical protein